MSRIRLCMEREIILKKKRDQIKQKIEEEANKRAERLWKENLLRQKIESAASACLKIANHFKN